MKLIVGLGNPGKKYVYTRHNIGFMVIDELCRELNIKLSSDSKLKCEMIKTSIDSKPVIIAKPSTYMNLSGECIKAIVDYYEIKSCDILIIHDDKDLDIGVIKPKLLGSSGGQNGMKSIINIIGTQNLKRLKIGIGKPINNTSEYVLDKFNNDQLQEINAIIKLSAKAVKEFVVDDFNLMANKYSRR